MWTEEEDNLLRRAIEKYGEDWTEVVREVPGRNKLQCVQRWKKTLRPGLTKGPWKPEEDALLLKVMSEEMEGDWQAIARRVPGRNAKQCKERWTLNLNPEINHGPWTPEEDESLVELHAEIGGKWSILAKRLPGRTEHAIKTRFLSLQRQAAKVRGWTVDEDRIILKQFMMAESLNGSAGAIKALQGRTKKQVVQRFQYLREQFVSIDDLVTANPKGNVMLTEQDLRILVPHPSLSQGSGDVLSSAASSPSTSAGGYMQIPSPAAKAAAGKALARRHHGSSGVSQNVRHIAKKLEKSTSSSSNSVRTPGMGLLQAAYGSSSSAYNTNQQGGSGGANDSFMSGIERSIMEMSTTPTSFNEHTAGTPVPSLTYLAGKTESSSGSSSEGGTAENAGASFDVPMLSSRQYSNASNSLMGGGRSLGTYPLSSSFLLPNSSSMMHESAQPTGVNGASARDQHGIGPRTDSFMVLAEELEQIAQKRQMQEQNASASARASASYSKPRYSGSNQQHSSSFMDLPLFPPVTDDFAQGLRPVFSSSSSAYPPEQTGNEQQMPINNSSLQRASSSSTAPPHAADYPVAMYRPSADPAAYVVNNEYLPSSFVATSLSAPQQPVGFGYAYPSALGDWSLQPPPTSYGEERKVLRQFGSSLTGPGTGSTLGPPTDGFDFNPLDFDVFPSDKEPIG